MSLTRQTTLKKALHQFHARPLFFILIGLGGILHGGTALLRLNTFWPYPHTLDFAAFYVGAWAIRLGHSVSNWPESLLLFLQNQAALPFVPSLPFNPPHLLLAFVPLTLLPFPAAAWVWFFLNLGLLVWVNRHLGCLAQLAHSWQRWLLFVLMISFGPVMLDLTLGQISVFLLFFAVIAGRSIHKSPGGIGISLGIASATATKLYPLLWFGVLLAMGRWQPMLLGGIFLVFSFALIGLWNPAVMWDWVLSVQERLLGVHSAPGINDQSLMAFLDRIGHSRQVNIPGLTATDLSPAGWILPWEIGPDVLRLAGYSGAGLIILGTFWVIWRRTREGKLESERALYLWVLVSLITFPHMERYNHALLLPAMAFLWGKSATGQRLVVIAYLLTGIARLTHLWVQILPAPWGPLLTGSGLFATIVLFWGLLRVGLNDAR